MEVKEKKLKLKKKKGKKSGYEFIPKYPHHYAKKLFNM